MGGKRYVVVDDLAGREGVDAVAGFSEGVRAVIRARAANVCDRCGMHRPGMQIHHRRPRRMGGSFQPDTNLAANGLYLCAKCHADVERHRTEAYAWGHLLTQQDVPDLTAVRLWDGWYWLLNCQPFALRCSLLTAATFENNALAVERGDLPGQWHPVVPSKATSALLDGAAVDAEQVSEIDDGPPGLPQQDQQPVDVVVEAAGQQGAQPPQDGDPLVE